MNQITFQLFCANGVREGTVGDPDAGGALTADGAVSLMDTATEPPTTLNSNTESCWPSTGYVMWIDANGGAAVTPGLQDCSPTVAIQPLSSISMLETVEPPTRPSRLTIPLQVLLLSRLHLRAQLSKDSTALRGVIMAWPFSGNADKIVTQMQTLQRND